MEKEELCARCSKPYRPGGGWLAHSRNRHVHAVCEYYHQNRQPVPQEIEPSDLAHRRPEEA